MDANNPSKSAQNWTLGKPSVGAIALAAIAGLFAVDIKLNPSIETARVEMARQGCVQIAQSADLYHHDHRLPTGGDMSFDRMGYEATFQCGEATKTFFSDGSAKGSMTSDGHVISNDEPTPAQLDLLNWRKARLAKQAAQPSQAAPKP